MVTDSADDAVVCFMAKYEKSMEPRKSGNWYIDYGCSYHMAYDKDLFSSYSQGSNSSVELGNRNFAVLSGCGTVDLTLLSRRNQRNVGSTTCCMFPNLSTNYFRSQVLTNQDTKFRSVQRNVELRKIIHFW